MMRLVLLSLNFFSYSLMLNIHNSPQYSIRGCIVKIQRRNDDAMRVYALRLKEGLCLIN